MCAWLLDQTNKEPGYFIGGLPKNFPSGAALGRTTRSLLGKGEPSPFVVEGDEYDAVYWDKRPKFFDYVDAAPRPVVILTSCEHDHIDIYPDAASYEAQFVELVTRVPEDGLHHRRRLAGGGATHRAGPTRRRRSPSTRSTATTRATRRRAGWAPPRGWR